jgi:hypothetical protein
MYSAGDSFIKHRKACPTFMGKVTGNEAILEAGG